MVEIPLHGLTLEVHPMRRCRRITMTALSQDRVRVSVPMGLSMQQVMDHVAPYEAQLRRMVQAKAAPKRYVTGSTASVLGVNYKLSCHESPKVKKPEALIKGVTLFVYVPVGEGEAACEQAVNALRDALLTRTIENLLQKWQPVMGVQAREWHLKRMKTRWGTCNHVAHRLWFNRALGEKPREQIEYVVVHELCHLLVHDHSPAFWDRMNRFLPDWRTRRRRLNDRRASP